MERCGATLRRRIPAVPASAIANAPTPAAAPMPPEPQSKPDRDALALGCGVGVSVVEAGSGRPGGGSILAVAGPASAPAARTAASEAVMMRVARMTLLVVLRRPVAVAAATVARAGHFPAIRAHFSP